jgi:hypothetical protein
MSGWKYRITGDEPPNFLLIVVSDLEGEKAKPRVRVIVEPLKQLKTAESSVVSFTGVRDSRGLV